MAMIIKQSASGKYAALAVIKEAWDRKGVGLESKEIADRVGISLSSLNKSLRSLIKSKNIIMEYERIGALHIYTYKYNDKI